MIRLETQELSPEDTAQVINLMQRQLWVAFAETDIKPSDLEIPESTPEFKGDPTPSQRLRNRLYAYYKESRHSDDGFKSWYEGVLDDLGKKYLEKLT